MPPKSSKFRGVTLFRPTKKWRAQISAAGKTTSLGCVYAEHVVLGSWRRAAPNPIDATRSQTSAFASRFSPFLFSLGGSTCKLHDEICR